MLTATPTMEEVKEAVFNLCPDSAPGPDGFSGHFFTACWSIISVDVHAAVQEFFETAILPRALMATHIVLIPKGPSPASMKEFRPISLCNFAYKIISLIFCRRLASILPKLISPFQGAFTKGRDITDNICLAQELVHNISHKVRGQNVIIKLDMMKAYDRLEWGFLFDILSKFGFSQTWINLIKGLFTKCWFSVIFNGNLGGFFPSSRGLRQGDPLAPSLFILAEEALSRGLQDLFCKKIITPFATAREGPIVSHLLFADDTVIFTNGSQGSLRRMMAFLNLYEIYSGQKINLAKSSFYMADTTITQKINQVKSILNIPHKKFPIIYLGAPLFKGAARRSYFQPILDKLRNMISIWKNKLLSQGGRLILIKHVLSSIPIHILSAVTPPKSVIQDIERLIANFFWGESEVGKRRHWIAWANLTRPVSEGGIGIRSIFDIQLALKLKLCWKVYTKKGVWSWYINHCYLSQHHFFHCPITGSPSWRKLLLCRFWLKENSFCLAGEGNFSFWHDNWTGFGSLRDFLTGDQWISIGSARDWLVQDFIMQGTQIFSQLPEDISQDLIQFSEGFKVMDKYSDKIIWKPDSHGVFSTKSAWNTVRVHNDKMQFTKWLWHAFIPKKISIFIYRLMLGKVPFDFDVQRLGVPLASKCVCCKLNKCESSTHVIIKSEKATYCWQFFRRLFGLNSQFQSIENNFSLFWAEATNSSLYSFCMAVIPCVTAWELWKDRCAAKFRNVRTSMRAILVQIQSEVRAICMHYHPKSPSTALQALTLSKMGLIDQCSPKIPKIVRWQKPHLGLHKLNTDGCSRGNPGESAGAAVLRNHQGSFVIAGSVYLGHCSSLVAEFRALIHGLHLCLSHGQTDLLVEMDCQLLVLICSIPPLDIPWQLFPWWNDYLQVKELMSLEFVHTVRECNKVADQLANNACTSKLSEVFLNVNSLPLAVKGSLLLDKAGVPNIRF